MIAIMTRGEVSPAEASHRDPLPRARIAVTRPVYLNGDYQFELVVVDGPRAGSCLAQVVVANTRTRQATSTIPTTPQTIKARASLRAAGEQVGFRVTDY